MNTGIPVVDELLVFHADEIHRWDQLICFVPNLW